MTTPHEQELRSGRVWGGTQRVPRLPKILPIPPVVGGYAAHNGWNKDVLEGLRPSKPPSLRKPCYEQPSHSDHSYRSARTIFIRAAWRAGTNAAKTPSSTPIAVAANSPAA